jgi:hypothetical protein
MFAILFLAAGLLALPSQAPGQDRFFKEEHYTGADYLLLRADGTYAITGREHMGLFALESGHWHKVGKQLAFSPTSSKKTPYNGAEITHRGRTFLTFDSENAPSILISAEDTRARLDSEPNGVPPYVFFEIDRATFERELKTTYPFRYRKPSATVRE